MSQILGVAAIGLIAYVLWSNVKGKATAPIPYIPPAPESLLMGTSPILGVGQAAGTTETGLGGAAAIGGENPFVSIEPV